MTKVLYEISYRTTKVLYEIGYRTTKVLCEISYRTAKVLCEISYRTTKVLCEISYRTTKVLCEIGYRTTKVLCEIGYRLLVVNYCCKALHQSTPNFSKNEHFLPPHTHTTCAYQGVRNVRFSVSLLEVCGDPDCNSDLASCKTHCAKNETSHYGFFQ